MLQLRKLNGMLLRIDYRLLKIEVLWLEAVDLRKIRLGRIRENERDEKNETQQGQDVWF